VQITTPTLVKTRIRQLRQPLEEIHEFEVAIAEGTDWDVVSGPPGMPLPMLKVAARVVRLLEIVLDHLLRLLPGKPRKSYLCIGYSAPHYLAYKTFPYFCVPAKLRMVWMYDAWENQLAEIENAFRVHRINIAFLTSLQATEYFNGRGIERFAAYWVPEAVTVANYRCKPPLERRIDVLQMGRRWDAYHDAIEQFCEREKLVYLYEKTPGEIIFPTRQEFLEALAGSKISICVPSSITHPWRSGKIATMTWRYLQSMAAKCLVLGRAPEEMKQLFDYDPVIEIDMSNPSGQLREVLNNYSHYLPLIERNYEFVQKHHQWPNRIALMQAGLEEFDRRCSW
jgi:hypothetical protein